MSIDLARLAVDAQKPKNKKAALKILDDLYEKHGDDKETQKMLASLYRHMVPNDPENKSVRKGIKEPCWQWVSLAMSKNDARTYLQSIHVDENHIEASDGHRMFRMRNEDGIEPGLYNADGSAFREQNLSYPNVGRVIPPYDECEKWFLNLENTAVISIGNRKSDRAYFFELDDGFGNVHNLTLNCLYVDDLVTACGHPRNNIPIFIPKAFDFSTGRGGPILFDIYGNGEALIMPISPQK